VTIDIEQVNRTLSMRRLAEAFAPGRMSAAGRRARMDLLALRMTRPSPYRATPPQRRAVTAGGWSGHTTGPCACGGHHQPRDGWHCLCQQCNPWRRGRVAP
jgi:hypothetical protein